MKEEIKVEEAEKILRDYTQQMAEEHAIKIDNNF
jgi:hypothetical protein